MSAIEPRVNALETAVSVIGGKVDQVITLVTELGDDVGTLRGEVGEITQARADAERAAEVDAEVRARLAAELARYGIDGPATGGAISGGHSAARVTTGEMPHPVLSLAGLPPVHGAGERILAMVERRPYLFVVGGVIALAIVFGSVGTLATLLGAAPRALVEDTVTPVEAPPPEPHPLLGPGLQP